MTTYVDPDGNPVVTINPGTEPVADTSAEAALLNVHQLAEDVGGKVLTSDNPHGPIFDGQGRYLIRMRNEHGVLVAVEMPGLPLDQVRYTGEPGQNIWDFPRLYVDGSSWVWKYAVNVIRDTEEPMQS